MFSQLGRSLKKTELRTKAIQIMQKYSEKIKGSNISGSTMLENKTYSEGNYTINVNKKTTDEPGMLKMTVEVVWDDNGKDRNVTSSFYIIQR